jgi:hypothetical protein
VVVFTILFIALLTTEIIIIAQIDITGHIEGQIHIEKIEPHITHEGVIIRQDEVLQIQEDLQELTIKITEALVQELLEATTLTKKEQQEAREILEVLEVITIDLQETLGVQVMQIVVITQEIKKQEEVLEDHKVIQLQQEVPELTLLTEIQKTLETLLILHLDKAQTKAPEVLLHQEEVLIEAHEALLLVVEAQEVVEDNFNQIF